MAFEVLGDLNGVAYTIAVGDGGEVTGSSRVLAALTAAEGTTVRATPTGPTYVVRKGDLESTWAWLARRTRVVETSGDLPEIIPPPIPGATY